MGQDWLVNLFFGIAVIFLAMITIGVGYLTLIDWREKRRETRKNKG